MANDIGFSREISRWIAPSIVSMQPLSDKRKQRLQRWKLLTAEFFQQLHQGQISAPSLIQIKGYLETGKDFPLPLAERIVRQAGFVKLPLPFFKRVAFLIKSSPNAEFLQALRDKRWDDVYATVRRGAGVGIECSRAALDFIRKNRATEAVCILTYNPASDFLKAIEELLELELLKSALPLILKAYPKDKDLKKVLYLKLIALDPTNAEWYYYLAVALGYNGRCRMPDGTEMSYQDILKKVVALDPECPNAFYRLAKHLPRREVTVLNGSPWTAEELCKQVIFLNPKDELAWLLLANMLDPDETIRLFNGCQMTRQALYEKVVELNPTIAEAHFKLAEIKPEMKMQYILAALHLDPKKAAYWRILATILPAGKKVRISSEQEVDHQAIYSMIVTLDPNDAEACFNLAITLPRDGNNRLPDGSQQNKEELLKKVIELDPVHARAYYELACVIGTEGHIKIGNRHLYYEELLARSIALKPDYLEPYWKLAKLLRDSIFRRTVYLEDHSWVTEQDIYKKIILIDPENHLAYKRLAQSLSSNKPTLMLDGSRMTKDELWTRCSVLSHAC